MGVKERKSYYIRKQTPHNIWFPYLQIREHCRVIAVTVVSRVGNRSDRSLLQRANVYNRPSKHKEVSQYSADPEGATNIMRHDYDTSQPCAACQRILHDIQTANTSQYYSTTVIKLFYGSSPLGQGYIRSSVLGHGNFQGVSN